MITILAVGLIALCVGVILVAYERTR